MTEKTFPTEATCRAEWNKRAALQEEFLNFEQYYGYRRHEAARGAVSDEDGEATRPAAVDKKVLEARCKQAWSAHEPIRAEFVVFERFLGYEKHVALTGGVSAIPQYKGQRADHGAPRVAAPAAVQTAPAIAQPSAPVVRGRPNQIPPELRVTGQVCVFDPIGSVMILKGKHGPQIKQRNIPGLGFVHVRDPVQPGWADLADPAVIDFLNAQGKQRLGGKLS